MIFVGFSFKWVFTIIFLNKKTKVVKHEKGEMGKIEICG